MFAEARRDQIMRLLHQNLGGIPTEDLASRLEVSVETIRRDLRELEKRSVIQRVHGGAMTARVSGEAPYGDRRQVALDEKRAISRSLVERIPDDSTVFFDLGTTVDEVVAALPPDFAGTCITTSLRTATELARLDSAEILVAGGRLRRDELALSGGMTQDLLGGVFPDIAVISTGAVNGSRGVTDFDAEELHVKRIMLANASTTYVVADSGKFGETATYRVCSVAEPSFIVSTTRVCDEDRAEIEAAGARLLLASIE